MRRNIIQNENFFDSIDTEEKAYWLGFVYADGCVWKDKTLTIHLNSKDVQHLEKFKSAIAASNNIYIYQNKSSIRITSNQIVSNLNKLGINNRKSYYNLTPPNINPLLESSFWRGVFDGDGCISINGSGETTVSLVGSYNTVLSFNERIKHITGRNIKITTIGNCSAVNMGGKFIVKKILDYLYLNSDSSTRLDRKYNLYLKFIKLTRSHKPKRGLSLIDVDRARILSKYGMKQRTIAEKLGVHESTISRIVNGNRRTRKF